MELNAVPPAIVATLIDDVFLYFFIDDGLSISSCDCRLQNLGVFIKEPK